MSDPVNHPAHYKAGNGLEAIDVIEGFSLGFHLGNVVKYLLRADRKGAALQDLCKARWYLEREIDRKHGADAFLRGLALSDYSLCYLATPYTKYPAGIEQAFVDASACAARLLKAGVKVYSPIAHTHPLAIHGGLDPLDHAIWLPFDQAMMEAADALIVAHMDGWHESYGVRHEMEFFAKAGKPIIHIDPVTLARGLPAPSDTARKTKGRG